MGALQNSGIRVTEFKKSDTTTPDSIFPDWITTHRNTDIPEGLLILYPMRHRSRQNERDYEIVEALRP